MKCIVLICICSLLSVNAIAQIEREPQPDDRPVNDIQITSLSNVLYGKLIDKNTGKGIEAASVQLFLNDKKDSLITGMLSRPNGEFRFSDLNKSDSFYLVISALGYEDHEQLITAQELFEGGNPGNNFTKDLGNISLSTDVKQLSNVIVSSTRPALEMGIDRKIFNVEKSLMATGGTAVDVMRNIPSVSVDIDGNVELRNSSPQIFVDGRPTVLTLDQIPADHIDKIELITNPSAKFDAASSGGIINVVLKKNKRVGFNGVATVSGGTPEYLNSNLNLNMRQGKFNVFASGGYNHSNVKPKGRTLRQNKDNGVVSNYFNQYTQNDRSRNNTFIRFGTDFFIDNRNTVTVSQSFVKGNAGNTETQDQEYLNANSILERYGSRIAIGKSDFSRRNTRFNYLHNFPKNGQELTADVNYNYSKRTDNSTINNSFFYPDGTSYSPSSFVWNNGQSLDDQITFQTDYTNPVNDAIKIEAGLRSYHSQSKSFYNAYADNNGQTVKLPLSNNYEYREMVNAGYFTFSYKKENFSFQTGLRAEQSQFKGTLIDSAYKFGYEYPNKIDRIWDALFPSLFVTKRIGEDNELQINYSRRIRRPRFWQLSPFIDINDPTNLQQGNPNLRPEFVNSFELNYSLNYNKGNFLGVVYFRNNPNDITQYSDTITTEQYQQLNNAAVDPNAILNTFINASTANMYGAELTLQHKLAKNLDLVPTMNLQYRTVKAKVNNLDLSNEGFNWEAKLIASYKIETAQKSFFNNLGFQVNGEYESPRVIPQGKRLEQFSVDFAMRKDFLKDKKAAITFGVNDIFNTRRWGTIYDTDQFYQDSYRRNNVRNFRLSFTYKFGDPNFSFTKKNNKSNDESEND